jgi:hypothetical protein
MAYDDWFQQTFNVDTSGNTDYGTGGDPGSYSGENYDAMFADMFSNTGANAGFNLPADYGGGGGDQPQMPAQEDEQSALAAAWDSSKNFILDVGDTLKTGAEKLFMTPEGTATARDPITGAITSRPVGGGLNTLGQTLLAGVLKSVGEGMNEKWKADTVAKENAKTRAATAKENDLNRKLTRESRDMAYARKEYGQAPQLGTPTRGVGLIGRT